MLHKFALNMTLGIDGHSIDKFIIVGDRVLIKPRTPDDRTRSGLFLPPGVEEKEKLNSGYVLKVGPGYAIPDVNEIDEAWKAKEKEAKYIPLQVKEGDLVVYLQHNGYEIEYNEEKYIILPYASILMIIRDEGLFE